MLASYKRIVDQIKQLQEEKKALLHKIVETYGEGATIEDDEGYTAKVSFTPESKSIDYKALAMSFEPTHATIEAFKTKKRAASVSIRNIKRI